MAPILFNIQDSLLHIEAIGMDVSPRLINIEPTLVRLQARARTPPQHLPRLRVRSAACHWMHLTQHAHWLFRYGVAHVFSCYPFWSLRMRALATLKGTCHAGTCHAMLKSTPIQSTKSCNGLNI